MLESSSRWMRPASTNDRLDQPAGESPEGGGGYGFFGQRSRLGVAVRGGATVGRWPHGACACGHRPQSSAGFSMRAHAVPALGRTGAATAVTHVRSEGSCGAAVIMGAASEDSAWKQTVATGREQERRG